MNLSGDKPASKKERERERERKDNKKPDEMREFIGGVAGRAETAEFQPRRGKFHPAFALI